MRQRRGERRRRRAAVDRGGTGAGTEIDWDAEPPVAPAFPGVHVLGGAEGFTVRELGAYIDWTPFFDLELAGEYPAFSKIRSSARRRRSADARAMLDQIEAARSLVPRGVLGLFPAASVGDDIQVYTDESRTESGQLLHGLRQQFAKDPRKT